MAKFAFVKNCAQPVIIAGPCTAESLEGMTAVAEAMTLLSRELKFQYVFKASFDKANRTSLSSQRGPGLEQALGWFQTIKQKFNVPVLTDIHESTQVAQVAEVCDVLQIPAFLCRQTDLLIAAVETGRAVNVKKGQFLAPDATSHIVKKATGCAQAKGLPLNMALTERGSSFGYGDLVVDMRGLPIMASNQVATIFDVTHSLQNPGTQNAAGTTGGLRQYAGVLARAATATGYLDGLFLEVHPDPAKAWSDASTQLNFAQAETLLRQVIPLWYQSKSYLADEAQFTR